MSATYRVALSGDFRKADGSPTFPDFDTRPLFDAPGVEVVYLDMASPVRADQVADIDALILLTPHFKAESVHPNGRLGVVARFGVGYDNVDVDACTKAGIALVITSYGRWARRKDFRFCRYRQYRCGAISISKAARHAVHRA